MYVCTCTCIDVDPSEDCIYFCGNSLGLQPVGTKEIVNKELDKWAKRYVCTSLSCMNDYTYTYDNYCCCYKCVFK